jgi:hypothetical protein
VQIYPKAVTGNLQFNVTLSHPTLLGCSRFPPNPRFPVPGSRPTLGSQFPSNPRFPVPGSRFPVPGSRFPVPSSHRTLGSRFPVPCSAPNPRFQLPGSRFLASNSMQGKPGCNGGEQGRSTRKGKQCKGGKPVSGLSSSQLSGLSGWKVDSGGSPCWSKTAKAVNNHKSTPGVQNAVALVVPI